MLMRAAPLLIPVSMLILLVVFLSPFFFAAADALQGLSCVSDALAAGDMDWDY
jgi:hypothetical protein